MAGKFIVFEGVDHSGKTTQLDLAEAFLKSDGRKFVRFREPGGTDIGERIRELLLDKAFVRMTARTEVMLFFASRVQLLDEKIIPALVGGTTVLLDRYYYSTAAYQGPFMDGGAGKILELAEKWFGLRRPDRVVYLDGDPVDLAVRKKGENDRIESKGIRYQLDVREAYLSMADRYRDIFRRIDAARQVDEVARDVESALKEILSR